MWKLLAGHVESHQWIQSVSLSYTINWCFINYLWFEWQTLITFPRQLGLGLGMEHRIKGQGLRERCWEAKRCLKTHSCCASKESEAPLWRSRIWGYWWARPQPSRSAGLLAGWGGHGHCMAPSVSCLSPHRKGIVMVFWPPGIEAEVELPVLVMPHSGTLERFPSHIAFLWPVHGAWPCLHMHPSSCLILLLQFRQPEESLWWIISHIW